MTKKGIDLQLPGGHYSLFNKKVTHTIDTIKCSSIGQRIYPLVQITENIQNQEKKSIRKKTPKIYIVRELKLKFQDKQRSDCQR